MEITRLTEDWKKLSEKLEEATSDKYRVQVSKIIPFSFPPSLLSLSVPLSHSCISFCSQPFPVSPGQPLWSRSLAATQGADI